MKQSKWLNEIFKHRPEGFDPYVEKHFETDEGLRYGNWNKYQGQKRIDERSVFPNEVIIDIDADTTEKCREETRKVTTYLENNGFDFILADTGGTGFHIHLFFEYKGLNSTDYRPYRIALYDYIKEECADKVKAETELWDRQPVKFDITNGKGHLVRAIGGRKKDTGYRKTEVLPTSMNKNEISDRQQIEYPNKLPWALRISKTGTDKADLSINQIKDKVEEVKNEEKQKHDKDVEVSVEKKIKGLDEVRNIDASKVLKMLGKDFKTSKNFECPFHSDSDPSATIFEKDGVERLYCFADSCVEESPPKVWNAVDILIEDGYTFNEALKKLSDEFDIDVQIGYNPHDYFDTNVKDNYVFQPYKTADEIMDEYLFKNVEEEGFYVWNDGVWKEIGQESNLIGREVDKRLKNETSARHRNNVRDIIKNEDDIECSREEFETPDDKIPFKNGVYDIERDELIQNKPEFNFDFRYDAEYRPDLENNDIERFIETLMPDSQDKQEKLKEIAALCLVPAKINQKVPIFYGQGSNGKNQFVKILWKMLGEGNYHKTSARKLQNDTFEMASVYDKQMAFFDEFEDVTKPGQLKTLVGDKQQNVREMRKESYTAKTSVYPIFAANELPKPSDNSDGFFRRWEIIDFPQQFTSQEDDGNPMKVPVKKLEEEYMHKDAIDAFATSLIDKVKQLRETHSLTAEQSTDEVRKAWKRKGNALYSFIDKFLTTGKIPEGDQESTDDWIKKDELLDIVNEYMQANNNSKIRKDQLTRALDSHPDFRIWTNYRPTAKDGSRPTAYAGLQFKQDRVKHVKVFLTFNAYVSPPITKLIERVQWFDIVDDRKLAEVLSYLNSTEKSEADMLELAREVDVKIDDLHNLEECDFVKRDAKNISGFQSPVYSIDKKAVVESDVDVDVVDNELVQVSNFIHDLVEDWSSDTEVEMEEILDKAQEQGLQKSKVEARIERMKENGELYEPSPGKVGKI